MLRYIYRIILVVIGSFFVFLAIIYVTPNKTYPDILFERLQHQTYDMASMSDYPEEPSAVDAAVLYDNNLYAISNFENQTRIVLLMKDGGMRTVFKHTFEAMPTLFHYTPDNGNIVYATSWGFYCFDPFDTATLLWSIPHMSDMETYGILGGTSTTLWLYYETHGARYVQQVSYDGELLQQLEIPFKDFYYCECNETGVFFFYRIEVGGDKRKKIQYTDWDFNIITEFDLDPILGVIRTTDTNLYTETYRSTMTRDKIIKYALDKAKPESHFDIPDREVDIASVYVNNVFPLGNRLFVTANLFSTQNAIVYQFNDETLERRYMVAHDPVERLNNIAVIESNNSYLVVSQDALKDDQAGRLFVGYMPK